MNISKLLVTSPNDDKTKVKSFLHSCNLTCYFDTFIEEGFDGMRSLFEVTESDLISMGIKRGHRRLLQRAIATARGIPLTTPIFIYKEPVPQNTNSKPSATATPATTTATATLDDDNSSGRPSSKKRKQYVPSRPITAFHEYLNEVRLNLRHDENLSKSTVNQIARQSWAGLKPVDKEKYERQALHANSDYVMDLMTDQEQR